jgi:hypothetical protein
MRSEHRVHIHLGILKESVGSDNSCLRTASLGDVGFRATIEVLSDHVKPFFKPIIVQTNGTELLFGPVSGGFRAMYSHLGLITKRLSPIRTERMYKDHLLNPVSTSCALTHMHEVGCPVGGPGPRGIDKCLYQDGTDMVTIFPILGYTGKSQRQHMGGKIDESVKSEEHITG